MDASDSTTSLLSNRDHCDAVADRWLEAVVSICGTPPSRDQLRQQLGIFSDRIVSVWVSTPFEPDKAQQIGAELARTCGGNPLVLGLSLETLYRHLPGGLTAAEETTLQPRLGALLGQLATGYLRNGPDKAGAKPTPDDAPGSVSDQTRELEATVARLHREISERSEAESSLRRSDSMVRTMVSAPTDVAAMVNPDGIILQCNENLGERFGRPSDELIGSCIWDLLPPEVARRRKEYVSEVLQSGRPVRFEDERAGTVFDNVFYPVIDDEGEVVGVAALARDITERRKMEEALRASLDELERSRRLLLALNQAGQSVLSTRTANEVYTCLGEGIASLGLEAAVLALTPDHEHLQVRYTTFRHSRIKVAEKLTGLPAKNYRFRLDPDGFHRRVLSRANATYAENTPARIAESLPPPLRSLSGQLATILGHERSIFARLAAGGETYGLLVVSGPDLRESDTPAVNAFANQTAIALNNARLHKNALDWAEELEMRVSERTEELLAANLELQGEIGQRRRAQRDMGRMRDALLRHQERMLALSRAGHAVQRARTRDDIFQSVGDELSRLGYHVVVFEVAQDYTYASISHTTLGSTALRSVEKLAGLTLGGTRIRLEMDTALLAVMEQGESVYIERIADRIARGVPDMGRALVDRVVTLLRVQKGIYSPLKLGGGRPGMLMVAGEDVREEDTAPVSLFANQASVAFENAHLVEELRTHREQMRQLTQKVVTAQEEERHRLSQSLHDEAGQALTALKISLELVEEDLPETEEALRQRLADSVQLADSTMERLRLLAHDLRPPALDAVGLNPTLEDYCRDYARRTRLAIRYQGSEGPRLAEPVRICLYRFLQEALTNVVKHAGDEKVRVRLQYDAEEVTLSVADDGKGFDAGSPAPASRALMGIGLVGMQERLESLGGRLSVTSAAGEGARLVACVPLQEENLDA